MKDEKYYKELSSIERQFEITKYLHTPRTMNEIKNKFGLSDGTLSHLFTDGKVKFLNIEFPLYRRKISRKNEFVSDSENADLLESNDSKLKSTVHPIVLPLNLTELEAITNHLLDMTKDSPNEYNIYKGIADKIYPQLSEYAKRRLKGNKHYLKEEGIVRFISEDEMIADDNSAILMYALKSSESIKLNLKGEEEIIGTVFQKGKEYYIKTDEGKEYNYSEIKYDVLSVEKVAK